MKLMSMLYRWAMTTRTAVLPAPTFKQGLEVRKLSRTQFLIAAVLVTGCGTALSDSRLTQEISVIRPVKETKAMSATNASTDVGQKSAEQVLMTLRDFLKDDQVTVSEATKQLIGSDIPVTPMNENISVGSVNLWKADIALWYLAAERRSLKPGAFEDGIVEKLYIAVDTKKICLSRDSADEIIKVKPQIQIPEFHVIRDLQFSKEQLTNPGWRVEYEFKGKKVYLAFRFKTCATLIDISSK